jgi:cyd operon protein YbgT
MWYFAWILGLGLAATIGILNAMWFELKRVRERPKNAPRPILEPQN